MAPIVAKLITVDFEQVLLKPDMGAIAGWACRAVILAGIGMFIGYLYEDETNKFKLFQLGMAAPALFLSTLTLNQPSVPEDRDTDGIVDVATEQPKPPPLICPAPTPMSVGKVQLMPAPVAPAPLDSFMFGLTLQKKAVKP